MPKRRRADLAANSSTAAPRAFFCAGRSASALLPASFASNPDGPCPMRILSLAVALFALAAVLVGLRAPDVGIFLYAAAALLCAGATYRSAHISTFLRVFEVVFAVETIVFGVAYLADALGLWPQAYADYALPSSLPLTVALFGSLIYAVSHIPVVRKMTDIADPYFSERALTTARIWPARPFDGRAEQAGDRRAGLPHRPQPVRSGAAGAAQLFQPRLLQRAAKQGRGRRSGPSCWRSSCPSPSIYIAALVVEYVVTSTFVSAGGAGSPRITSAAGSAAARIIRWRSPARPPTTPTSASAKTSTASSMAATGSGAGIFGYSITLLSTLTTLVSFAIVLWSLSAGFPLPGFNVIVPGLLFWIALIYAAIGTGFAHLIGRSLIRALFPPAAIRSEFPLRPRSSARIQRADRAAARRSGRDRAARCARFGDVFDNYMSIVTGAQTADRVHLPPTTR